MATVTLKGNPIHTTGDLPAVGSAAPAFTLTGADLGEVKLADFAGKQLVLNVFPSIDTGTCQASVRRFNQEAANLPDVVVLCVSNDLPFAQKRFCAAEGLENVKVASGFRNPEFAQAYGVLLTDGPLKGLMARSVVVVGADGAVKYTQLVGETAEEPDYAKALAAL